MRRRAREEAGRLHDSLEARFSSKEVQPCHELLSAMASALQGPESAARPNDRTRMLAERMAHEGVDIATLKSASLTPSAPLIWWMAMGDESLGMTQGEKIKLTAMLASKFSPPAPSALPGFGAEPLAPISRRV